MTCAPSEDSDQPGYPPSLIRVFTVRMRKPWLKRTAKTLSRLGECPDLSESSLDAHNLVGFVVLRLICGRRNLLLCWASTCMSTVCSISNEPHHEKTCYMPYANNKGADQPAHPRSLIRSYVVRCLVSVITRLATSEM